MKNLRILTIIFPLFLYFESEISAKTIYFVKQNATGNGSSWTMASGNIQAMIDKSVPGDQVWVAKGLYYPSKSARTFLLRDGVSLYGGFNGTENELLQRSLTDIDKNGIIEPWEFTNSTILSGNIDDIPDIWTKTLNSDGKTWKWVVTGNEANCENVVSGGLYFTGNIKTYFDGFIVEGGNADGIEDFQKAGGGINAQNNLIVQNCMINKCFATSCGGGIYSINSQVINCKVTNCFSQEGGGIGSSDYVVGCKVSDCSSFKGGGICASFVVDCEVSGCSSSYGGGIYSANFIFEPFSTKFTSVKNCTVKNCVASYGGGGIYSSYKITDTKISNCFSEYFGGGIYLTLYGNVLFCIVDNCYSSSDGGGIYSNTSGTLTYPCNILNSTIINCTALNIGGGIFSISSTQFADITNCAVFNCLAEKDGAGIYCENSYTKVKTCAASNNKVGSSISNYLFGTQINNITPELVVTFVKPTSFCGIAKTSIQNAELYSSNWNLCEGSPCINAGTSSSLTASYMKHGEIDIGVFEYSIPTISIPIVEDFNNWTDFEKSSLLYKSAQINTVKDMKWKIENKKAVFSSKTNSLSNYLESFFTYQIDAVKTTSVKLRYWMYFEAYSGIISPLGTEEFSIDYSTDFNKWYTIVKYSNQNGTIPNKAYLHDISSKVTGKTFFLRFSAYGSNTNRIEKWEIDNIIIDTDGKTTDINIVKGNTIKCYVSNGILTIENLNQNEIVQVYDIKGVLITNNKAFDNSIQLILPHKGVFLVKVNSNKGFNVEKVVW